MVRPSQAFSMIISPMFLGVIDLFNKDLKELPHILMLFVLHVF